MTSASRRSIWKRPYATLLIASALLSTGCATTKNLDTFQVQRYGAAQSHQAVDVLKTEVVLLKSLRVVVDILKGRFDGVQTALQSEVESHRTAFSNLRVNFKEFKVAHENAPTEIVNLG